MGLFVAESFRLERLLVPGDLTRHRIPRAQMSTVDWVLRGVLIHLLKSSTLIFGEILSLKL